jgi:hypothetical protein
MSLDTVSRSRPLGEGIHENHWCSVSGCGKWGGFGFSKGQAPSRWWCWEHYPHKPNQAQNDAVEIAEALRSLA